MADEVFDFNELMRILRIAKLEGVDALDEDDRRVYDAWTELAKEAFRLTPEELRVHAIMEQLPYGVAAKFEDWTLEQTALIWPMLRDELIAGGVDVEAAEKRATDAE